MTEDFKRKLTAILSADVVGYSRLMGDDESATVKTLETYKGVMSSLIKQHRGRVVDSPGDNLLAEFGSVVDAVQCAVSIQKELQTRNADLPENRKMEFRIGINLGDVIEEKDRIYGDGVNIAARLEALADPGGICVSKTAFDHIESKLPLGYEFLGEQTVKNIAKPVGAYKVLMERRVVDVKTKQKNKGISYWRKKSVLSVGIIVIMAIAAGLYWNFYLRGPSIEPASTEPAQVAVTQEVKQVTKTIAVLPFDDYSPEKDQEYFVLGLSEEILNSLTQIPDLTVTAKTSSFYFKDKDKTFKEIAKELDVEYILEGSVRKAGENIRITAQLIKAVDESHLWSETYDKKFNIEDIFSVQEDIANNVADKLKLALEAFQLLGGTENIRAYEKYLVAKGQFFNSDGNRALETLDEVITLDPEFAIAWAWKSIVQSSIIGSAPIESLSVHLNESQNAALRAIELEPNLGKAYLSLGSAYSTRGEYIEAELAYRKGIELTTESIDYFEYGLIGHYLSVGYLRKCKELLEDLRRNDPLHPYLSSVYILSLGLLGDMEHAEEEYERGKIIFSGDQNWLIGDVSISILKFNNKDGLSIDDFPEILRSVEPIEIWSKSPEERLAEIHRINVSVKDRTPLYRTPLYFSYIALEAAYLGDPQYALDVFEKTSNLRVVYWSPVMKEVRQLPRFKELMKDVGLVDYWKEYGWPDLCHPVGDDFKCE